MKLFYTLFLFTVLSITEAQVPGLFKFTYSDYAGNGLTPDGKGAIYNFNNGNLNNCYDPAAPVSSPLAHMYGNYSVALDSTNGYLKVGINSTPSNYSQTGLHVHTFQRNCDWLTMIDMRDPANCVLEIRVKSDVNLDHFRILVATGISPAPGGLWIMSSGLGVTDNSLVAGQWTTIKQSAGFLGYYYASDPDWQMDSSKVIGFGLVGYNDGGTGVTAQLEIDYVRMGSAVTATAPTEYEMGRGTEWSYGSVFPDCPRFIDVLNNPYADVSYNASNELELVQTGSVGDEFFVANIFSDQYCIPLPLDMSALNNQKFEIDIYSDQDIPEFAIDLNGYDEDGVWDVGTLPAYQSLTGGTVNHLEFILPVTTVNGKNFDLKRITGYNLFIPSNATTRTTSSSLYNLRVNSLTVSNSVVTANINTGNSSIGLYPNPTEGNIYINGNREGQLQISDLTGRKQFETYLNSSQELNLTLAKGIYLVSLTTNSGIRYTEKLIIR